LGKPVIAVVEAEPYYTKDLLTMAPYAVGFTPYHIPRVEGQQENIDALITDLASIPAAGSCQLNNPTPEQLPDPAYVQSIIAQSIAINLCEPGIYAVAGFVFDARNGNVVLVELPSYPREY